MKKMIIAMAITSLLAPAAWSHPPTDIELKYDQGRQVLSVSMTHVSRRMADHYIRLVKVYKNDADVEAVVSPRQTRPNGQDVQVTVTAEPGDVLSIKAYCSKGGIGEATLTVEEPEAETQKGE